VISFLVTLAMLWPSPDFRFRYDRRAFDGERYVEFCAGLYQRPETWACVEVQR
jgi:hypothetical protein